MVLTIHSSTLDGIDGLPVRVEIDAGRGLPAFHLVGLPGAAVRESRQRVLAAVRNCALQRPKGRVVVNLAPVDVQKRGAATDLAIAVGVALAGEGRSAERLADAVFLGELSLDGTLRPVPGVLAMVEGAVASGRCRVVVPAEQAWEAALVPGAAVQGAGDLAEAVRWALGESPPTPPTQTPAARVGGPPPGVVEFARQLSPHLQRVAMIAAVGRHDLLLVGPPGSGKTRLARVVGALAPPLAPPAALEVARIHSAAGLLRGAGLDLRRPFRAPHHTVTGAGLLGGGAALRAGEVTLAHRGVLFLDELTEFAPAVLDALREPLEEGVVAVARAGGCRIWPADFQLVAAMNPCRCGWFGSRGRACRCAPHRRRREMSRLSGPFLDRIDLFAESEEEPPERAESAGAPADWTQLVAAAAAAQARLASRRGPQWRRAATLDEARGLVDAAGGRLLDDARRSLGLSVRALVRCAGVAATLAALDDAGIAGRRQVAEALGYRRENVAALASEQA